jgi:hypothetical protein
MGPHACCTRWANRRPGGTRLATPLGPGTRGATTEERWIQAIGEPSASAERSLCIQAMQLAIGR